MAWASGDVARGLGRLVELLCVGMLAAFVGMIQGTDTSVRENTLFAISGFGFLTIGVATCSALVASQREILRIALAVAYAANGILLAVALYAATNDDSRHNNIQQASIYYGLAFISVNAMSVRAAYLKRLIDR